MLKITTSSLTFSIISAALIFGTPIYAAGISVDIGSDDLSVPAGGISVEIDDSAVDASLRVPAGVSTEENPLSADTGSSYANADIEGHDFSNQNLINTDFSNADLTQVNLSGANLSGANFSNATFINCDLRGAIVEGADFSNADFGSSKISGVDFSRANMSNVDIGNVNTEENASLSSNNIEIILTNNQGEQSPSVNLDIRFAYDSDRVEVKSMQQISDLSAALNAQSIQSKSVVIEGHTDSDGADDYNLNLSERRAKSVIDILVRDFGITSTRLTAKGYGEKEPVYSNETDFGKSVNRRVTVLLSES